MYRIQAFNIKEKYFIGHTCKTMEERETFIKKLIDSGNYVSAGISWEWLARY
jgi:hypothetical protein